jgi:hypothetical protein
VLGVEAAGFNQIVTGVKADDGGAQLSGAAFNGGEQRGAARASQSLIDVLATAYTRVAEVLMRFSQLS